MTKRDRVGLSVGHLVVAVAMGTLLLASRAARSRNMRARHIHM